MHKKALAVLLIAFISIQAGVFAGQYCIAQQVETKDYYEEVHFNMDGSQSFFYVERDNKSEIGYINLTHDGGSLELDFNVINLAVIIVDCYELFNAVKDDVWYFPFDDHWYYDWIASKDEFVINYNSTVDVSNYILFDMPEPEMVLLDDVIYTNWTYENDNLYTSLPSGIHEVTVSMTGRSFEGLYDYEFELDEGWNMLSNPLNTDLNVSWILDIDGVYMVSIRNDSGVYYTLFKWLDTNETIGYLDGFLVYCTKELSFSINSSRAPSSKELLKGWNFVGMYNDIYVSSLPSEVLMISFRVGSVYYTQSAIHIQNTVLNRGEGYYMYASKNITI